jgi:hypothetical protein
MTQAHLNAFYYTKMLELASSLNIDDKTLDEALRSAMPIRALKSIELIELAATLKVGDLLSAELFQVA